jgi:hypothetical protein
VTVIVVLAAIVIAMAFTQSSLLSFSTSSFLHHTPLPSQVRKSGPERLPDKLRRLVRYESLYGRYLDHHDADRETAAGNSRLGGDGGGGGSGGSGGWRGGRVDLNRHESLVAFRLRMRRERQGRVEWEARVALARSRSRVRFAVGGVGKGGVGGVVGGVGGGVGWVGKGKGGSKVAAMDGSVSVPGAGAGADDMFQQTFVQSKYYAQSQAQGQGQKSGKSQGSTMIAGPGSGHGQGQGSGLGLGFVQRGIAKQHRSTGDLIGLHKPSLLTTANGTGIGTGRKSGSGGKSPASAHGTPMRRQVSGKTAIASHSRVLQHRYSNRRLSYPSLMATDVATMAGPVTVATT